MGFEQILLGIGKTAEKANPIKDGDYISSDGLIYCGVCNTPKQCYSTLPSVLGGGNGIFPCPCDCVRVADEAEQEAIKAARQEISRREAFSDSEAVHSTFAADDTPESQLSKICRAYARKFSPDESKWLLLYGGCGVGKSYMAACIVNEVINAGYTARFTSISQIERFLWDAESKAAVYRRLNLYDLLVIDDLSAERSTPYMEEIIFNVIDERLSSGKPAIITTNLSADDFKNPKELAQQRIFSRLYEKSIPIRVDGADRRLKKMKATTHDEIKRLLT